MGIILDRQQLIVGGYV